MQIALSEFIDEITAHKQPFTYLYETRDTHGNVEVLCEHIVSEVKHLENKNKISIVGKDEDTTWLMQTFDCDAINSIDKSINDSTITYLLLVGQNTFISLRVDFY